MKTKGKKQLIILIPVSALIYLNLVAVVLGEKDYRKLRAVPTSFDNHYTEAAADGGTLRYRGFGYNLDSVHALYVEKGERVGFTVGPRISYSLWVIPGFLLSREDTEVEYDSNRKNSQQESSPAPSGPET